MEEDKVNDGELVGNLKVVENLSPELEETYNEEEFNNNNSNQLQESMKYTSDNEEESKLSDKQSDPIITSNSKTLKNGNYKPFNKR